MQQSLFGYIFIYFWERMFVNYDYQQMPEKSFNSYWFQQDGALRYQTRNQ